MRTILATALVLAMAAVAVSCAAPSYPYNQGADPYGYSGSSYGTGRHYSNYGG